MSSVGDDPLGDAFRRKRHWLWIFPAFLGVTDGVRAVHDHGPVAGALDAAMIFSFWSLLTWRFASRRSVDDPELYRGLVIGWSVWLTVYLVLEVVDAAEGRFRWPTLFLPALGSLFVVGHYVALKRTSRGLPAIRRPGQLESP